MCVNHCASIHNTIFSPLFIRWWKKTQPRLGLRRKREIPPPPPPRKKILFCAKKDVRRIQHFPFLMQRINSHMYFGVNARDTPRHGAGVNGAQLLCSGAPIINHENGHILVVPVLSLRALIKQFCGLESQIPLLQITINYAESAQRCWTQLYSAQPWLRGDSLFWRLLPLHSLCLSPTSTFVNWAPPANKLRIMCCFFHYKHVWGAQTN